MEEAAFQGYTRTEAKREFLAWLAKCNFDSPVYDVTEIEEAKSAKTYMIGKMRVMPKGKERADYAKEISVVSRRLEFLEIDNDPVFGNGK